MRPAALLTGLTGVVAVLVLVYVGLTAMNLQPHITFGDPDRAVAVADASGTKAPSSPVAPPAAPAVVATTAPPAEKAATAGQPAGSPPATGKSSPTPAGVAATASVAPTPSASTDAVADGKKDLAPTPASVPPVKLPVEAEKEAPSVAESKPSVTPGTPPQAAPAPPSPSVPSAMAAPPVVAEAPAAAADALQSLAPAVVPAVKPDTANNKSAPESLPSLAEIPTPQLRPEPPKPEVPKEEAKAVAEADKPTAAAPATEAQKPVEEASLPPSQATPPVKPAEPVQNDKAAEPTQSADLKQVDLSRPLAERAGILTIGNKVVQLAGIQPTDPTRSCTGPNGKEWPCGTLARTALRAFLLGRTVTCDVPDPKWIGPVTAECRFARVDLSDWLARNGWAEPAAGSPLMTAADEARKDGRGIYGNDPRKKHVSTLAPEPPPEDPLNPI